MSGFGPRTSPEPSNQAVKRLRRGLSPDEQERVLLRYPGDV